MRAIRAGIGIIWFVFVIALASAAADPRQPLWAYSQERPYQPGDKITPAPPVVLGLHEGEDPVAMTRLLRVPGSERTYTPLDLRSSRLSIIDWFPGDHPPPPPVVKHGPERMTLFRNACGSCHMPHGLGRPHNAGLAGLPRGYILQQLQDFRAGLRRPADPRKTNTLMMIELAKGISEEEMNAAADYFSSLAYTPWTRVVETDLVPRTKLVGMNVVPIELKRTEPIGTRIVEVAEDEEQYKLFNPRSGFVAYVPTGSIKRGEALVLTGGAKVVNGETVPGKTIACITCHGPDLRGLADFPPLAGRSPSYLARQLYDFQQGTRKGPLAVTMTPVVANLDAEDMVAITAYLASLPPGGRAPGGSSN